MTLKSLLAAVAATVALALPIAAAAHDGVRIVDPYARLSAKSGAVFFKMENHAMEDDRLIAARTDLAQKAELHTHIDDGNGVMQMREIEGGIPIVGMEQHSLVRGGDHVMLMGLARSLQDGDTFTLILTFERTGDVTVEVPVDNDRMPAVQPDGNMHEMDPAMDHDTMMHGTEGHMVDGDAETN